MGRQQAPRGASGAGGCGWSLRCARSTRRSGRDHCGRGDVGDRHPGDVAELDPPGGGRYRSASGVSSQMAEENKALRKQVAERWSGQ